MSSLTTKILTGLANAKNSTVAAAIGADESFVSRFTSGERGLKIQQMEEFFEALGLKVIDCKGGATVEITNEEYQALKTLARKALI